MSYKIFFDECEELISKNSLSLSEAMNEVRSNWITNRKYKDFLAFLLDNYNNLFTDFSIPFLDALLVNNEISLYKDYWKTCMHESVNRFWNNYEFYNKNYHNKPKKSLLTFFQKQEKIINKEKITTEELLIIDKSLLEENNEKLPSKQDVKLNFIYRWHKTLDFIDTFIEAMQRIDDTSEIQKAKTIKQSIYTLKKTKPKKTTDKRKMDEILFWDLIETSRNESDINSEFLEVLQNKLEAMSATEIKKFKKYLLEKMDELYHWDIWALAYIVRGGCGDDAFDYFNAWVVSKGKDVFETIKNMQIENFKELFSQEDPQLEEFMYVANEAYENKKGEAMPELRIKSQKIQGAEWNEKEICLQYPELCKMF